MPAEIHVGPVWSDIRGGQYIPWKELDQKCSYFPAGAVYTKAFKQHRWDGVIHLYKNGRFPTGLLSIIRGILDAHKIPYDMFQDFEWPERKYNWNLKPDVVMRDRHVEALDTIAKCRRGTLQLPTRFGKTTVVASGSIANFGVPTLFIAHQLDLIYDAKKIFEQFIDGVGEIGIIGDGLCEYRPLTVACIDSLANKLNDYTMLKYLHEKVKYVIVDETQYFGPGEYKDVLYQCDAPYRIFMSATVDRMDGAELEIQAASGRMIYSLNEEDMIAEGYISDVDVEMIPFNHRLFNEKATGVKYPDFYKEFIATNVTRNQVIVNEVMELLYQGHPTLVIVTRIEHGHLLKEMLINNGIFRTEFIWGDVDPKQRIELRERFNNGEFDVLIGSTVFDTAIDLHRATGLVLAGAGSSRIRAPQRVGRVLSQVMGKVAIVKDIKDMNIKYFAEDAKDRQQVYTSRYGDSRVHVRHQRDLTDEEILFGIDARAMFDKLL